MTGTAMNTLKADSRPIAEKCEGCDRIAASGDVKTCTAFAFPETKWRMGNCSMATHIKVESAKGEKVRVGQQKQKKH